MNPEIKWGLLRTGGHLPDVWCDCFNYTKFTSAKKMAVKECARFQGDYPKYTYLVKKYPHRRKS